MEIPICARWVLFQIGLQEIEAKMRDGQTIHSGPSFARLPYMYSSPLGQSFEPACESCCGRTYFDRVSSSCSSPPLNTRKGLDFNTCSTLFARCHSSLFHRSLMAVVKEMEGQQITTNFLLTTSSLQLGQCTYCCPHGCSGLLSVWRDSCAAQCNVVIVLMLV